jgi:hypothetical protein
VTGWLQKGSLTTWFVVLALLVAILGSVVLAWRHDRERNVVVAKLAIDAFGVADQLKMQSLDRGNLPADPVETVESAKGRYVVRSVKAGEVVAVDDIGPKLRSSSEVVVPVPLKSDRSADLREGQVADLVLAPTAENVRPAVVGNALVVHVAEESGRRIAYFAVPRAAESQVAAVLARGDALIATLP